jgi:iron complex outermembrane receptor protein
MMNIFNKYHLSITLGFLLVANSNFAQDLIEPHPEHHDVEEVLVSGILGKAQKDTALPVNVLTGEQLRENAASTIGETLQNQIGVNTASFGPGVGQPVIRGQSANRVQVLQNGTGALDVSNTSQDHANTVEGLLAERIEVIRGPATLLYGNGAIGGVVNVIDNRIPDEVPEAPIGADEYRYNNNNDGSTVVGTVTGGTGNWAWHVDGVLQDTDNVVIPGYSNLEGDEHEEEEHEGEEHEEHEEEEGTFGFIDNSNSEKTNLTAGTSYVTDRGFIGISINQLDNQYGLPPGAHGHHEEGEEEHTGEEEEEEEEIIRLDMEQTRVDIKADYDLQGSLFENIRATLTSNDYTHTELEGDEIGTVFNSEGLEFRTNAKFRVPGIGEGLLGSIGLQYIDRDFSAIGEEAFIPVSNINSFGLYAVDSVDVGAFTYEGGVRFDRQKIDASLPCNRSDSSTTVSAASIWNFSNDANVMVSLNRSQRAPSIEELYSNVAAIGCAASTGLPAPDGLVAHAATGRFELGNAQLEKETATNLEVAYRKHAGNFKAEVSAFINSINDYVYLADIGEIDETIVSRYLQEDARFIGVETQVELPVKEFSGKEFHVNLFADYVEAEIDSGAYLPRIPPLRAGFELVTHADDWTIKLRNTFVDSQEKISLNESATDSYHRLDLFADYHLHYGDKDLLLFAKAKNLGNEDIRNHTSYLKSFAPEAGRSVEFGVRYSF